MAPGALRDSRGRASPVCRLNSITRSAPTDVKRMPRRRAQPTSPTMSLPNPYSPRTHGTQVDLTHSDAGYSEYSEQVDQEDFIEEGGPVHSHSVEEEYYEELNPDGHHHVGDTYEEYGPEVRTPTASPELPIPRHRRRTQSKGGWATRDFGQSLHRIGGILEELAAEMHFQADRRERNAARLKKREGSRSTLSDVSSSTPPHRGRERYSASAVPEGITTSQARTSQLAPSRTRESEAYTSDPYGSQIDDELLMAQYRAKLREAELHQVMPPPPSIRMPLPEPNISGDAYTAPSPLVTSEVINTPHQNSYPRRRQLSHYSNNTIEYVTPEQSHYSDPDIPSRRRRSHISSGGISHRS